MLLVHHRAPLRAVVAAAAVVAVVVAAGGVLRDDAAVAQADSGLRAPAPQCIATGPNQLLLALVECQNKKQK